MAILAWVLFWSVRWLSRVSFESLPLESEMETVNDKIYQGSDIPVDAEMIIVDKPRANQTVQSPLDIRGEARGVWFFEGSFPVRIVDGGGRVLGEGSAKALSEWMTTEFVPFESTIAFDSQDAGEGMLILENDNPSGSDENKKSVSIPLFFKTGNETTIKVFFGNSNFDPQQKNCWTVYAVNRKVPKVSKIGQLALEELLKGPTDEEKENGYFTSIQEGTMLNGLSIQHGVAFADFNEQLDKNVGGSCRIMAIRSQIEQTLKQFPTVKEVQIYIGERSKDVLQP